MLEWGEPETCRATSSPRGVGEHLGKIRVRLWLGLGRSWLGLRLWLGIKVRLQQMNVINVKVMSAGNMYVCEVRLNDIYIY